MLGEIIEVSSSAIDPLRAVGVIEDYKPLDVECAAVNLALLAGIRERYPDWRLLVDGDGGDENLKDYPIEENSELTIRSVVNNSMLYQEGWGVELDQAFPDLLRWIQPRLRPELRLRASIRIRWIQPVHSSVGDRRGGGDSVRRADAKDRTRDCTP